MHTHTRTHTRTHTHTHTHTHTTFGGGWNDNPSQGLPTAVHTQSFSPLDHRGGTGFRSLNGSNAKLPVCVTTQSLISLNYRSCTALPSLFALHQTHACSNSYASTAKLMAFALSPILVLTFGTTSHKMSDTTSLPSFKNKFKTFLVCEHFN